MFIMGSIRFDAVFIQVVGLVYGALVGWLIRYERYPLHLRVVSLGSSSSSNVGIPASIPKPGVCKE